LRRILCLLAMPLFCVGVLDCQIIHPKALIVVNGEYTSFTNISSSTSKDGEAMKIALSSIGFGPGDYTELHDLDSKTFLNKIREFTSHLGGDDSVMFYFSGHGFSFDGVDYLAPIDFPLKTASQKSLKQAVRLSEVLDLLKVARLRVVILDACREELLVNKGWEASGPMAGRINTLGPMPTNGAIVAFSSRLGEVSNAQAEGGMSRYTYYLTRNLRSGPTEITEAFRKTAVDVAAASHEQQHPAYYDELEGTFALVTHPSSIASGPQAQQPKSAHKELQEAANRLSAIASDLEGGAEDIRMGQGHAYDSVLNPGMDDATRKKAKDRVDTRLAFKFYGFEAIATDRFRALVPALSKAHQDAISRMQVTDNMKFSPNQLRQDDKEFQSALDEAMHDPEVISLDDISKLGDKRFLKLELYLDKLRQELDDYREVPLSQ